MALPMESSLVTDVNKKVSLTLASSLVPDMAPILTNGALENMDLPMALPMALSTTLPTALPMTLSMALLTYPPIASSLVTDASDEVCSTLTSSLVIDETNIDLPLPLLPYPNMVLPFHFHCITGIDLTYLLSYLPSLLLKDLLSNERNELSPNYTTTRKYTQAIVNIAINSDVRY